jgi:hypothetical protein
MKGVQVFNMDAFSSEVDGKWITDEDHLFGRLAQWTDKPVIVVGSSDNSHELLQTLHRRHDFVSMILCPASIESFRMWQTSAITNVESLKSQLPHDPVGTGWSVEWCDKLLGILRYRSGMTERRVVKLYSQRPAFPESILIIPDITTSEMNQGFHTDDDNKEEEAKNG